MKQSQHQSNTIKEDESAELLTVRVKPQQSVLDKTMWENLTGLEFLDVPLDVSSSKDKSTLTTAPAVAATLDTEAVLQSLTQPLIDQNVWDNLSGLEFTENIDALDRLAAMGERIASHDESNDWIDWQAQGNKSPRSSKSTSLRDGAIHVWTGRTTRTQCYGSELPFIKTRSILPMSVSEMVDLMMDSERVQTYNPWSLGRRDCWVHNTTNTKIVQNTVQPPLGSKTMVSTTLLHARPASTVPNAWVIVSRSVGPGSAFAAAAPGSSSSTTTTSASGRSDILLGVNLLEAIDDDTCQLTAVTHVHSQGVPNMLAERLGVQSAIKFVRDMRGLKATAAASETESATAAVAE
jgi:hypothetical protein